MRPRSTILLRRLAAALMVCAAPFVLAQELIPAPPDLTEPPVDAERSESGLLSKVLIPGAGTATPDDTSHVIIHYTVWTADGKMFDSSVARKKMASLELSVMIEGFVEGVKHMVQGETRRLWIPAELGYAGIEGKPQGDLVFDVQLIDFVSTPADVEAPPAEAERSKSGLAWTVLRPGEGSVHPKRSTRVQVHYSGWTTHGKMFDSSVQRGKPTSFKLNEVIKGWTEGLQLMVEGEKRRFWVPERLAYKGVRDRPQGMLVFDVELIAIQ